MGTDIEALKLKRSRVRGWCTRHADILSAFLKKHIEGTLEDPESTLQNAVEEFDRQIMSLEVVEEELEALIEEENFLTHIEERSDFRLNVRKARVKARSVLKRMQSAELSHSYLNTSSSSSSSLVKLPRIELPHFSGEVMEWPSFWDKFVTAVDSTDIPAVAKFSYLQPLLEGEAKQCIQGLTITEEHYKVACSLLKNRFGRDERIIFAHLQALLNLPVPKNLHTGQLRKLADELETHIRCLDTLNIKGEQYGVVLTPILLSRLPQNIRMEWAREGESREGDLDWLLQFLSREIERRERCESFKEPSNSRDKESKGQKEARNQKMPTMSALQVASNTNTCEICHKWHATERCYMLTNVPLQDRREVMMKAGICFLCLKRGHLSRECSAKCSKCKGYHHQLCCTRQPNRSPQQKSEPKDPASSSQSTAAASPSTVPKEASLSSFSTASRATVLQTARVIVIGPNGRQVTANLLFDSGSDRSYVSSSFVSKVQPKFIRSQSVSYAAFGSSSSTQRQRKVFELNIYSTCMLNSPENNCHVRVTEVPVICANMRRRSIPCNVLDSLLNVTNLADDYLSDRSVSVDILIGLDHYWQIMGREVRSVGDGLVAQNSKFGSVLSGSVLGNEENFGSSDNSNVQLLCLDVNDAMIRSMWELDSLGIAADENVACDNSLMKDFEKSISFQDKRYEVSLPWTSDFTNGKVKLLNNEGMAQARLRSLTRKLSKNPQLQVEYDQVLTDMEKEGIIHEVPNDELVSPHPTFYMPHRPVIRASSATTKIRPVFDASAEGCNGISLNKCLETGPSLLPNLIDILIRFRRKAVALTADIKKAFLQISVKKVDRDVHRFLWEKNGDIRIMRFARLPFGNRSSPFLLNATIRHHLSKFEDSPLCDDLRANLYCDDWLSGADSTEEAFWMFSSARSLMAEASMPLVKWNSNCEFVIDMLSQQSEEKHLLSECSKILGVKWTPNSDCFSFEGVPIRNDLIMTKRTLLSMIARLYDPLGFISPYAITVKILFQSLWRMGLTWDEEMPDELQLRFKDWIEGLERLKEWRIPRTYGPSPWMEVSQIEIHAFSDASEQAYASVVYIRFVAMGEMHCSLVCSKARVAPLKKVTLPRLELLGALLSCRLAPTVLKALCLPAETAVFYWTDSMIVLNWVKSNPNKWKPFVANRVHEIQNASEPSCWSHCPGSMNPADLMTRGLSAENLMKSNWLSLHGPEYDQLFSQSVEHLPNDDCLLSVINEIEPCLVSVESENENFDISHWSSLMKAVTVFAWIGRFIRNVRSRAQDPLHGPLNGDELTNAKLQLLKLEQGKAFSSELACLRQGSSVPSQSPIYKLSPFLANDGFLRIQGRLQESDLDYDCKHPIILPNAHLALLIVRFTHVSKKHMGVSSMIAHLRNSYWIVGLRRLAKRVKRECVFCQRYDSRPQNRPTPPLPGLRIQQSPPFTATGLDFAGPLFCSDSPQKMYILLFTCAVTRAMHLELTSSLTLEDCMLAIRRFAARRGVPSVICSDNAKTFKAAALQLQQLFGFSAPKWQFIIPASPWWGAWWERLVRSLKTALRKTFGKRCLTRIELQTALCEVEACINSRPLTFVSDSCEFDSPLTPSHFLIGKDAGLKLDVSLDTPSCQIDLTAYYNRREERLDVFWKRWSKEYLCNLPPLINKCKLHGSIAIGSVVLIREDNTPRLKWPLGVVEEVFPGKDGFVRSVRIRTSKGVVLRPIQRLYDLEVSHYPDADPLPKCSNAESSKPANEPRSDAPQSEDAQPGNSGELSEGNNSASAQQRPRRIRKPVVRLEYS